MTGPRVPDLPAGWPPTAAQLAVLTTDVHWLLTDIAYELPRGQADRERLDHTATALERLAALLRQHEPRGVIRGEVGGPRMGP